MIRSLLSRSVLRRDSIGILGMIVAAAAILVNALYLQPGPHPAPIFTVRPRPVATAEPTGSVFVIPRPRPTDAAAGRPDAPSAPRTRVEIVSDIQRELERRGFYDGPIDGAYGPKTDTAIRDFEQAAALKPSTEPNEDLLRAISRSTVKSASAGHAAPPVPAGTGTRSDPIAELIAPSAKRVMAVQRILGDFGYGPVKPTGTFSPETKAAIERFERERRLPVTGQISDRLIRELAAATGRPLE